MKFRKGALAFAIAITGLNIIPTALAQADAKAPASADKAPDFEFVASVNGTAITQGLFNLTIRALVNQGRVWWRFAEGRQRVCQGRQLGQENERRRLVCQHRCKT